MKSGFLLHYKKRPILRVRRGELQYLRGRVLLSYLSPSYLTTVLNVLHNLLRKHAVALRQSMSPPCKNQIVQLIDSIIFKRSSNVAGDSAPSFGYSTWGRTRPSEVPPGGREPGNVGGKRHPSGVLLDLPL